MIADLGAADPIVALLSWLRSHPAVLTEFGDATRVGGLNEAPYPRVVVAPSPGGDDGSLVWLMHPEVTVSVLGDLDGTPGQAELRRLLFVVLAAVMGIPYAEPQRDIAVVSRVRPSSAARFDPEPLTRQPAWRSTLIVSVHPPTLVTTASLTGSGSLNA